MAIGRGMRGFLAAVAGAALLTAMPAVAQTHSDGFKFLEAIDKKDVNTVEDLLNKNGTVIDARDVTDGHSGLHIAAKRQDSTWLRYLLSKGANPNVADKAGVTPIMLAAQLGWVEGIAILAAKGARVDTTNDAGETPLISAVHQRDLPMVRILLAAGADPDRSDNSGRSARDYAKLDGAAGQALEEIERHDKSKSGKKPTKVYGPTY